MHQMDISDLPRELNDTSMTSRPDRSRRKSLFSASSTKSVGRRNFTRHVHRNSGPSSEFTFTQIIDAPISPDIAIENYRHLLLESEIYEISCYSEIYYIRDKAPNEPESSRLSNFYFEVKPNTHIKYRYQQLEEIGRGAFGSVIKCFDHKDKQIVALKMIRDTPKGKGQVRCEHVSLDKAAKLDPDGENNIVRLLDTFIYRGFVCFVLEMLGDSIDMTLRKMKFQHMKLDDIRVVARDIAKALVFAHDCNIIHCDLSSTNVVWTCHKQNRAKLIDFGCSQISKDKILMYVQSLPYRAPEIILSQPFTFSADIWSFGCFVAEMAIGKCLFDGSTENEQLMLYASLLGNPPLRMIQDSNAFYNGTSVRNILPSKKIMPSSRNLSGILKLKDESLIDFILKCLKWNPDERSTARNLLDHPFLKAVM